jgi:MFS family permease
MELSQALGTGVARRRAEDVPTARRVAAFIFLMAFDFFYGWAWNTVDVLRPDIRASLHLSLSAAALMYTAQSAGALTGALIVGQAADRFGRRNALFVVMTGYALALGAGAFVTDLTQLLTQRFVLGLFLGGVFPVAVSLYTSWFDRKVCGRLAGFYNGTFNGSIVVLGFIVATFHVGDWRALLLGGAIPALLLAPLCFLIVPDDRRITPHGAAPVQPKASRLPAGELFAPEWRPITWRLALMIGLNFFAYQAFAGWQSTYLQETLGLPSETAKALLAWQFGATIAGGFLWGALSDRLGRRFNSLGFFLGAALIVVYVATPHPLPMLYGLSVLFGLLLPASVIWGPWIAEIYPPHLRSTAASIFNWGRIISLFSPPITAAVAEHFGLATAMAMAAVSFSLAALVWRTLPETVR